MKPGKKAPVIPLMNEYNEADLHVIQHELRTVDVNTGMTETVKLDVPQLSMEADPYEKLCFLDKFSQAAMALGWDNDDKLYQKFLLHVQGDSLESWEEAQVQALAATTQRSGTRPPFQNALAVQKSIELEGYHYHTQMDYLRAVKKPGSLSPAKFLLKLKAGVRMALQLPDAPQTGGGFSEEELKRYFLQAMPLSWQDKMTDANMDEHSCDINEIINFMMKQHAKDPYVEKKSGGANGNNNSSNSSKNNTNNSSSSSNQSSRRGRNNRGRRNGRQGRGNI